MMRNGLNGLLNSIQTLLTIIPWWAFVLLVVFLGFKQTGKIKTGIVYGLMLTAIGIVGLWGLMLTTLSIVIASVTLSILMGFPIGILISTSDRANRWVRPVLDTMQTMPVFVYLIPAVLLFGLGKTPAVIATTIYAIVPIIRLTNLGIRQVDTEVVEAAKAFGSTKSQAMMKVQIPQAWPTIMAGVNQTLMMAMAMVVTASMIGAAGLGMEVLISVNRVEVGRGLVSGTAVVLLAILLDRLSQGWTKEKKEDI
jgi:glycine betaine/proline transport system permease protein/glycine betaine/proline transport system substrate-binding protein